MKNYTDYHNHLNPKQIAEDFQFENITQVWLYGDHYKWRAMRAFGIDEKYITGNASDKEKFLKWAEVVPYTIKNPLFHWTALELKAYFNIDEMGESQLEKWYVRTSILFYYNLLFSNIETQHKLCCFKNESGKIIKNSISVRKSVRVVLLFFGNRTNSIPWHGSTFITMRRELKS